MIDEHREELAALYALDLLEGTEHAGFEAELADDPALGRLVREFRTATVALTHVAPGVTPPDSLRARVLASARKTAPRSTNILSFPALAPWAIAACFAGLAAWLGENYVASQSEATLLQDQIAAAELTIRSVKNENDAAQLIAGRQIDQLSQQAAETAQRLAATEQRATAAQARVASLQRELQTQGDLANFKITTLASLLKNSPEALAVAVWNPAKQEGVLTVDKLPALAADKEYQLWVVDPQYPNPVDGGVFTVDAQSGAARVKFTGRQPVAAISAFAVTLERKGGVPKAEGPFVLLGK